ncbi:MAG: hypothetical protein LBB40_04380, partial [Holophagales bacterium]|nr:hypothetical protein [Holophagales bacterium]
NEAGRDTGADGEMEGADRNRVLQLPQLSGYQTLWRFHIKIAFRNFDMKVFEVVSQCWRILI